MSGFAATVPRDIRHGCLKATVARDPRYLGQILPKSEVSQHPSYLETLRTTFIFASE